MMIFVLLLIQLLVATVKKKIKGEAHIHYIALLHNNGFSGRSACMLPLSCNSISNV